MQKLMVTMGLPSYRILIMESPCPKDAIATIDWVEDRHVAQLYLSKKWHEHSDDEQRDTIVHETLHVWHRGLTDWLHAELQDLMHDHEFDRISRQYQHHVELMVDQMALTLANVLLIKQDWDECHSGCAAA